MFRYQYKVGKKIFGQNQLGVAVKQTVISFVPITNLHPPKQYEIGAKFSLRWSNWR